jgi:sugar lactone lactonase YvrE
LSLSVSVTVPDLKFQWYKDRVPVSGAKQRLFTLKTITTADQGNYTVVVSNSFGSVTSEPLWIEKSSPSTGTTPSAAAPTYQWTSFATKATFEKPQGIAIDRAGNLFVSDDGIHLITKITPTAVISVFAGSKGRAGSQDGKSSSARFREPSGIITDGSGNVYVADEDNHLIRKITAAGIVSTIAGSPVLNGVTNGNSAAARFNAPEGLALDTQGNLYVADTNSHTIRKITASGVVSTFAGSPGLPGFTDGQGTASNFNLPDGLAVDSQGNVCVADTYNAAIRKITPAGLVSTLQTRSSVDGSQMQFNAPEGIAIDSNDYLFISDQTAIYQITPEGEVFIIGGKAVNSDSSNGAPGRITFERARDITIDKKRRALRHR